MSLAKGKRRLGLFTGNVAGYVAGTIYLSRHVYALGKDTVVTCRQGHLFITVWIPGASVKSLRLGIWRLQWCPVGRHVALVRLVKEADLTEDERSFAHAHHDIPVP